MKTSIVVWAKDKATAEKTASDQYFLYGILMADNSNSSKEFLKELELNKECSLSYQISSNSTRGGYDVQLTIKSKDMGVFSRIVGIFTSPRETFASIDRKPTWLIPFLIMIVVVTVMQLLTLDINIQDRIAQMEAKGAPQEQIDAAQNMMQGGMKYLGLAVAPIGILLVWSVIAGILLFGGNTIMGGTSTFKKMLSLVSWSGLIGILAVVIQTFLMTSKGTRLGVTTSLAAFLPAPTWEAPPSVLYRFLSKLDIFTVWEMILWVIGISVMYRFTMKKSAILIGSIWAVWIIISVALGGLFANLGM